MDSLPSFNTIIFGIYTSLILHFPPIKFIYSMQSEHTAIYYVDVIYYDVDVIYYDDVV